MKASARNRILSCLFPLALLFGYIIVIVSAPRPPAFVDYPDWVYEGELLHHVLSGHPLAGYLLKSYPVPNSLTSAGLGLLDTILPWQWSAKLWIVGYLLLAGICMIVLTRALRIDSVRPVLALPAILFLNLNFWYGHISFEIGLCLTLLLAAMLLREAGPAPIAAMLVLLFFTHMEACAAGLLLLLLWSMVQRRWRLLPAALPAIGLTAWYALARARNGDADVHGLAAATYRYGSPVFLLFKANTLTKSFGYVNATAGSGASVSEAIFGRPMFLSLFAVGIVLAGCCLAAIAQALPRQTSPPTRTLALFVLLLFALAAVLPQTWLGVADPGSRLILLALSFGLLLADWPSRLGATITALSLILGTANLYQFARVSQNPQIAAHPADLPAPLLRYGHVEPGSRLIFYEKLERGEFDLPIFPTALFVQSRP